MKRSKHNLSKSQLATFNMGELVPVGLTQVLPGDTFDASTSALIRVSPLLAPIMHPVHVRIHHFFVPHRLVWEDWEDFITGGPDGDDLSEFPTITLSAGSGPAIGSLSDYFGVPPLVDNQVVSALPYRGYAMIWNEFYRDQDLETALTIDLTSGNDNTTNTTLQNICWEKDYFTSARVDPQKGTAVTLPLGTSAPVSRVSNAAAWKVYDAGGNTLSGADTLWSDASGNLETSTGPVDASLDPNGGLIADLSTATAVDVNTVRLAFAVQRFQEARSRFGSRYTEYLRYLGVRSSDARLQRPEYLGGGKQTIQFSEVLQTGTAFDANTGVGNMKGHGIGAVRSNRYRRFFEEHGYVFTLMSVKPKTIYASGLPRHFSYTTKEDFWQKELEHIGQQEVYNKEVYAAAADPDAVFGYQDRYDELRRGESMIAGEFRDSTYNFWHYARIFASEPALNADFVKCVPTTRVYASTTTDQLLVMSQHRIHARRLVSKVGSSFIF